MRLTRLFVEEPLAAGSRRELAGAAANHVRRVLRARIGDSLTLFDGRGGEFAATVAEIHRNTVSVSVGEHRAIERESVLQLTLAQGISRGERMDWVIQKATELGVSRIVPVLTERSVVRLEESRAEKKARHWHGIAVGACEQSGRNRVPSVAEPIELRNYLGACAETGARVLLAPDATLRLGDHECTFPSMTMLLGPEGGLSASEQEAAIAAGFRPARLGPRVLRTETAAIAALAAIQLRFGDL
ncbi:MAG TPA: 16S rRNA (uracil(1498)-N(3))-methyltransferase [Steroidobacteraceae bacterium]|nr:16S rRNA (uracil(1498)-N(3))-methyltransferase [Steroidobacteraceae bacterium]